MTLFISSADTLKVWDSSSAGLLCGMRRCPFLKGAFLLSDIVLILDGVIVVTELRFKLIGFVCDSVSKTDCRNFEEVIDKRSPVMFTYWLKVFTFVNILLLCMKFNLFINCAFFDNLMFGEVSYTL